jgi:endonuclease III related protein
MKRPLKLERKDKFRQDTLNPIFNKLYKSFGPQYWWPGETPFEVIVGAILTQNTNWGNVEKALNNLKENNFLSPKGLNSISRKKLAHLIKPAGYFNVKALRLKNFMNFLFGEYQGSLKKMAKEDGIILRERLLSINGIGPETADSILLYAFEKPVFVVDAYTKRIFSRHNVVDAEDDYHAIQKIFIDFLPRNVKLFNEYHALIVRLGKYYCKTKPLCEECPLNQESFYYVKK